LIKNVSEILNQLGSVRLLAATKQQSIAKIKKAIQAGIFIFGENYLQEAIPKIEALKNENIEWHFIGSIQSNKTKKLAQYFDWIESLDRKKIATQLNIFRPSSLPPMNICIEINESSDTHKSGIKLSELPHFIVHLKTLPQLKWRGLMTMVTKDYEVVSKAFYHLKNQGYDIDTLSMGMSQDYKKAIELGATLVRLGTLIFGERKSL
jgi:pyridoxal phosphate enzyme (YggS family)